MKLTAWNLLLLAGFSLIPGASQAQDEPIELADTIVVTATRTPITYSELSRTMTIIGPEEIAAAPATSLIDILAYAPGVDLRRRGMHGVHADLGIRGGSFEQTLILVDGLKVADPQTGHHNLDLPFDLADIERIEIVRGSGSKLYGPNAMSGVINVITRNSDQNRFRLTSIVGEHRYAEQQLSTAITSDSISHHISMTRRMSSGFRNNTEFDLSNFSYRRSHRIERGRIDFSAGYSDKEFGAHRFYSDGFPDEWEATSTLFVSGATRLLFGDRLLSARTSWRRHEDDFVLDRSRPDWFRNRHTTEQYGVELQVTAPNSLGDLVLGGEVGAERVESSSLGDHDRTRGGLFVEQRWLPTPKLSLVPGASVYWHDGYGWDIWPGLDIGYQLTGATRVYATANRSYRVPNYTELYYWSQANIGNPDLEPEKAASFELGSRLTTEKFRASAAMFLRRGTNMIDWSRHSGSSVWQVRNVAELTTRGLEAGLETRSLIYSGRFDLTRLGLQYVYLDTDHSSGADESKYLLEHLQHQLIANIDGLIYNRLQMNWVICYSDRLEAKESVVVDAKLAASIGSAKLFVEVSNLFDEEYSEIRDVPMPGRWFRAGLTLDLISR